MYKIAFGVAVSLLVSLPIAAQFPVNTRTPVIDNERVRVWLNGSPTAKLSTDAVSVFVTASSAGANYLPQRGPSTLVIGGAMLPGGNPESGVPTGPSTLYVELKDAVVSPIPNSSGFPSAFPRTGARELLDNARVTVWEFRWVQGMPTAMHFHDKDVVVLFLEDGGLLSTTPSGDKTLNEYTPGTVRFNARDRVHTETLTRGTQRAVMVELK